MAEELFDRFAKLFVLTEVIETLVISERYGEAIAMAMEAQNISQGLGENIENWTLGEIALLFSETAQFETAIAFAEQIQGDSQDVIFLDIIAGLIRSGRYEQAFDVLQRQLRGKNVIEGVELRILRTGVVSGLAQENQFARALEIAESIASDYYRDVAFKAIAAALAESGQYEPALDLTNRIETPKQKIDALNSVAIALIESDQIDQGLEVLEQALRSSK